MKIQLSKIVIFLMALCLIACRGGNSSQTINYKQEMRDFVQNISTHAKTINPNFLIIPQNGVNLISLIAKSGELSMDYINAIDGIGQEDLFYGYDKDDQVTLTEDREFLINFLDIAKSKKVKILVIDYCSTHSKVNNSYLQNNLKGYISFAAKERELNAIPAYPNPIYNENSNDITNLQEAKNFLYLISLDDKFSSKKEFINALKKTNYDLIVMDFFYNQTAFTKDEIKALKQKANGKKRLVISYMSIGEAEDYRYYWKDNWNDEKPTFIVEENSFWKGNYIVKYWEKEWQKIIFKNKNSYLNQILNAGFDGVYLDIIDAFKKFEKGS